jgi:glycosyltransferase involved in cell wall biosynthesis
MPARFEVPAPFEDASFDVVVLLATLEHIRDKEGLVQECHRLVRRDGRVIVTVPSPHVDHLLAALSALRLIDGMALEEHHGFAPAATPSLFLAAGFHLEHSQRFQLGLNHLFVFHKPHRPAGPARAAAAVANSGYRRGELAPHAEDREALPRRGPLVKQGKAARPRPAGARPLVSVLLPVYKPHPVFFPVAVRSVLAQTLGDFELLIAERPSALSAAEMLRQTPDPRITHLLCPEPTSLVEQLNRGLRVARGRYIARLDADDIADPRRLEKQVSYLEEHPGIDVLGSQVRIIDAAGEEVGYRSYPLDHDAIVAALRRRNPLNHSAATFAREGILAAGGYGYARYPVEDYELWCRLARRGARFANHPDILLRYRVHGEQVKVVSLRAMLRGTLEVKQLYWRGQMDWGDKARLWGERLLSLLPPRLVLSLFAMTHYSKRSPAPSPGPAEAARPELVPATTAAVLAAPSTEMAEQTC